MGTDPDPPIRFVFLYRPVTVTQFPANLVIGNFGLMIGQIDHRITRQEN